MNYFIVMLIFLVVGSACAGKYYNINGTKYYISYPMSKNYHEASRFCAINGMHLVSVHTQANHNSLMAAINSWNSTYPFIDFWTGGTSLGHYEKEFYWATTGFPVTFTNWIAGHPKNIDRKCILLHGGTNHKYKWYDQFCHASHNFICEDKILLPITVKDHQCEF